MANSQSVALPFAENTFDVPLSLYDAVIPRPLDAMDQGPSLQHEGVLWGDFTLYSEEDNLEEKSALQYPSGHPAGTPQAPTESPNSSWSHEDALGSPILSSASQHSEDEGSLSSSEDLNALAERRLQEDDRGKRRRKLSAFAPSKRSPVQNKIAPERKTKIRRPRKPSFFCRWKGCEASFTRKREFEMHMGKHEKPLFFCEICQQLLTRKDNCKKHEESKRHRENQANLANSTVLSTTTTTNSSPSPSSSSLSSSSSSSSGLSDSHPSPKLSPTVSVSSSLPYLGGTPLLINQLPLYSDVGNQHTITDFFPLNTEAKMLMLQAKIAALGKNAEALNFEIREVMQEMETIRRET